VSSEASAGLDSTAMKSSTLALLGTVLIACSNDDAGLTDTTSSTGPSTSATASTVDSSGSESTHAGSTTTGADTTDGEPTDPTPILEREPMPTHACEETRAMTQSTGTVAGRSDALVAVDGEYFMLRSSSTLTLSNIALDGTTGDEVVLDAEAFGFHSATSIVVDTSIVVVWTNSGGASPILRYAAVDDTLGTVVAPKDITGITGEYVTTAAIVPSPTGGVALLYEVSDAAGQTSLRFSTLDVDGEITGTPVDVAEVGRLYGMAPVGAAATSDGGYAVSYVVGDSIQTEVFFVVLDANGTQRIAPRRISREAGDGWSSELGGARRRSLLPVGDRFWVAFTESWFDPDPRQLQGYVTVKLAIVDAQGQSEDHLLQAPVEGENNLWPSFVELDDRVGLLWTSGTIIWICVGCISDNDLQFVLLDPDAVVPASNVVTQLHQPNGIVGPLGAFVGADMLTAASLDFHAVTLPASGALRCEPTG